jgi:peptidoglycan/LPS O-acetylase OafA/YrhL
MDVKSEDADRLEETGTTVQNDAVPRTNKFGSIRLLLAFLVIVSHSSELVDGNRSREMLTRIFGTISLGEFAVNGFFLVSGYLITNSFTQSSTNLHYLSKRVLRIAPAFVVAYLVTLTLIGPLVGGKLSSLAGPMAYESMARMLLLLGPKLDGALAGAPDPQLNSSMWTIAYEFRCYILVMVLGSLGLFSHRKLYLAMTAGLLMLSIAKFSYDLPPTVTAVIGQVREDIHFLTVFSIGGAAYLFRDRIVYSGRAACVAACVFLALMFSTRLAGSATTVLEGYILFWFAMATKPNSFDTVGRSTDISYGLYLYAWPVQNAIIWFWPGISPVMVLCTSTPIAAALGYASWTLVERPFLSFKSRPYGALLTKETP